MEFGILPILKNVEFLFFRLVLMSEFWFMLYTGHLQLFIIQFLATLWYNMFMIVSSHDFEDSEGVKDLKPIRDWGHH